MITSITKGARYVPSTPESGEEYVLRRDQVSFLGNWNLSNLSKQIC